METGFVLSQDGQQIQDILNYVEQQLPGTLEALSKAIGDEATRATDKENELARTLIPKTEKGAANGVASLNGGGQVPNDQLQWSMRGALNPSDIDSTSLAAGIYQVNGKVLSPAILGGEGANGVMVQYPWGSRVQLLLVGRAGGASAGEQVEIYVRRYLPTPKRWTAWMTTANFAKKEDIVTINERLAGIADDVEHFNAIVPSTASAQNQLADKDFVNHSIATNTANFIGTFASVAELEAYSGPKTSNDYAFVIEQDAQGNEYYDRYKWNGSAWLFEYRIESTAFTAAQWAAIQSGITSALVTKLQGLENYDDTAIRNAIALIEQNVADNTSAIEKKLNAFDFDVAFSEKVVQNAADYIPSPSKLGYWGTSRTNKHVAIATTPGEKFLLVSTAETFSGKNVYAFLTSEYNGGKSDSPMPLVEGTDVGILGNFESVVVTIPDGCYFLVVTKIYSNNSITDIYSYRSEHLSDYAKITTAQAEEDNVDLNENELKNVVIPIVIPNGYTFGAFQNVSVTNATDGGTGYADVIIQSFSSTNGVFNVALRNIGASAARVKLSVSVLLYK